jgi:hypothetical protein
MATIECKLAMCTSRLVELELLLELKIEQKSCTSLVKLVLSRRKSGLRTERLSVPVIYFGIRGGISRTSPNIKMKSMKKSYWKKKMAALVMMIRTLKKTTSRTQYSNITHMSTVTMNHHPSLWIIELDRPTTQL